jgi:hypothetical protein
MKPIRLSNHALGYTGRRGFSIAEVEAAIRGSTWKATAFGRLECNMDFEFGGEWNGHTYPIKRVRPVFVDEEMEIVVVTVYTYYF